MNLFITGAGGYIGGSVALALMAEGHQVRGLTRNEDSAARLAAVGIQSVLGSLDDANLLTREAHLADGVINAASSDHAAAVRALLDGLVGSGKPFLHTSGSSVVGDDARGAFRADLVFDGESPWVVHPSKQARHEIDQQVLGAAQRGVRSVVICPSLIYGTGRGLNPHSVQIPFLAGYASTHGAVPIVGAGQTVWSHVHIDDVVDLFRRALTSAPAGAFYFAENGESLWADIAATLAARLTQGRVVHLAAEDAAERWGEPRAYFSFGSNSRVSAGRARRELGWKPQHASVLDWIAHEMPVTAPASPNA